MPGLQMEKGTLGIIAEGAYADLLIVGGNLEDLGVLMNPEKNLKFIMKDGAVSQERAVPPRRTKFRRP